MPQTKSAKKALRQNYVRRKRNVGRKKEVKGAIKKFKKLVAEGKLEEARGQLPQVYKTLDKIAKIKLIKRGKADRLKSRLSKKLVTSK
ncbi:MAG: 30S ribosomal protein S20 [Patescibacteria group bacterium]|nr:30S ribosomal protein S20 [Patescibacteria group bacterium]